MSAIDKATAASASLSAAQENRMPCFSTSSAMGMLWQKASGQMNLQELEWLAEGAATQVSYETRALAQVLENTGCLVMEDDGNTGSFQSAHGSSNLLFHLHYQLSTLAGLAEVAADASFRVRLALKGGAA